ncbi:MAG: HAD family hydrolase [Clostridia bacterium]|nr:HAD family hydrolase [Clostridia bacterium]
MVDGIIFDLDGTMWDSCDAVLIAWDETSRKYGCGALTKKDMQGIMGMVIKDAGVKLFGKYVGEEKAKEIAAECAEREIAYLEKMGGKLYPKLCETLSELKKKYPLFIVSNCENGYIEAFMKYHDTAKFFDDYEHCGRTGLTKDGNIKLLTKRNNLKSPVYVGDTQTDRDAANAAGAAFIYAAYGFGTVDSFDAEIETFADLPNALETL